MAQPAKDKQRRQQGSRKDRKQGPGKGKGKGRGRVKGGAIFLPNPLHGSHTVIKFTYPSPPPNELAWQIELMDQIMDLTEDTYSALSKQTSGAMPMKLEGNVGTLSLPPVDAVKKFVADLDKNWAMRPFNLHNVDMKVSYVKTVSLFVASFHSTCGAFLKKHMSKMGLKVSSAKALGRPRPDHLSPFIVVVKDTRAARALIKQGRFHIFSSAGFCSVREFELVPPAQRQHVPDNPPPEQDQKEEKQAEDGDPPAQEHAQPVHSPAQEHAQPQEAQAQPQADKKGSGKKGSPSRSPKSPKPRRSRRKKGSPRHSGKKHWVQVPDPQQLAKELEEDEAKQSQEPGPESDSDSSHASDDQVMFDAPTAGGSPRKAPASHQQNAHDVHPLDKEAFAEVQQQYISHGKGVMGSAASQSRESVEEESDSGDGQDDDQDEHQDGDVKMKDVNIAPETGV